MPSINQDQIDSINNKCSNEWKLDIEYYFYHGEKTLIKQIRLDEQHYLEFALRYNHRNQISLHISKFYHEKGATFASTSGMGKSKVLDTTTYTRKNVSKLIEFTQALYDEQLLEINKNTEVSKSNGLILQSEDF